VHTPTNLHTTTTAPRGMDTNKLRTALGDTSEILSEAIIRCQLSHRAKDSDLLELKRQLDDILASVLLYKSLSNTLPPSSFLSTSFLRFAFPRAPAEPGCFATRRPLCRKSDLRRGIRGTHQYLLITLSFSTVTERGRRSNLGGIFSVNSAALCSP